LMAYPMIARICNRRVARIRG
jgi:ribosomal protein L7/L12